MKKIFELGASSDFQDYKNQAIIASNKLSLALFITGLIFLITSVLFVQPLIVHAGALIILTVAAFILNYFKFPDLSRFALVAGSTALVAALHIQAALPGTLVAGLYLVQFALIVLPWLITDFRETTLLAVSSLTAILVFISQPSLIERFHDSSGAAFSYPSIIDYFSYIIFFVVAIFSLNNMRILVVKNEVETAGIDDQIKEKKRQMTNRQEELRKRINEINETHKIEERRSWLAQGVSQMIDLMRSKKENLFPELIEEIVKYLDAAVGVIYSFKNEEFEEKQLVAEGCYAYDRRKYLKLTIPYGDGLVGQCCLDREIVYLSNVPPSFLDITSGLGDTPPEHLAIVPLLEEQNLAGVLEIAAHNEFEEHHKEFLNQLSASIASFILTNAVNQKIKLLIEQNQSQAEEMKAQEEEMLQNMEELHATQEEMSRKEKEYIARIEELEKKLNGQSNAH